MNSNNIKKYNLQHIITTLKKQKGGSNREKILSNIFGYKPPDNTSRINSLNDIKIKLAKIERDFEIYEDTLNSPQSTNSDAFKLKLKENKTTGGENIFTSKEDILNSSNDTPENNAINTAKELDKMLSYFIGGGDGVDDNDNEISDEVVDDSNKEEDIKEKNNSQKKITDMIENLKKRILKLKSEIDELKDLIEKDNSVKSLEISDIYEEGNLKHKEGVPVLSSYEKRKLKVIDEAIKSKINEYKNIEKQNNVIKDTIDKYLSEGSIVSDTFFSKIKKTFSKKKDIEDDIKEEIVGIKQQKASNDPVQTDDKKTLREELDIHNTNIIEFDETIMKAANGIITLLILIMFGIYLAVFVISILNMIIYFFDTIGYSFWYAFNNDITIYQLFSYKILKYVNILVNNPKNSDKSDATNINGEPFFFAITEQYIIYIILDFIIAIIFIVLFVTLIYFTLITIGNAIQPKFKVKGSLGSFKSILFLLCGIMMFFIIISMISYKFIFSDIIYSKIYKIKKEHNDIDASIFTFITDNCPDPNNCNIDINLCNELNKKNKDIVNINNYFKIDGSYDNVDEKKTIQMAFLYCLYKYLYDIVPNTNTDSINLINQFFIAPPSTGDPNDVRDNGFLTFISFLKDDDIHIIQKYYEDLEIFNDEKFIATTKYTNVKKKLDDKIDALNNSILNHLDIGTPLSILGGYFFLMLIVNLLCICCVIYIILKDKRDGTGVFPTMLIDLLQQISDFIYNNIFKYLYDKFLKSN